MGVPSPTLLAVIVRRVDADAECQAVIDLELQLLDPAVRREATTVLGLLHDDYREFGASGQVWTRETVAQAIASDDQRITTREMRATHLAPDVVLLSYRADRPQRSTLRSSVWVRQHGSWLLRFHQGTVVGN